METQPLKRLLTITELSAHLTIKKATLYSWVEQNRIPHLKIHGLIRKNPVRYSKDDLESCAESH